MKKKDPLALSQRKLALEETWLYRIILRASGAVEMGTQKYYNRTFLWKKKNPLALSQRKLALE